MWGQPLINLLGCYQMGIAKMFRAIPHDLDILQMGVKHQPLIANYTSKNYFQYLGMSFFLSSSIGFFTATTA
jgi:hypothetical protein